MTDTKVVRSKDLLDAISDVFEPLKGQHLPVSDVGFELYKRLASVPEFFAESLLEIRPGMEYHTVEAPPQSCDVCGRVMTLDEVIELMAAGLPRLCSEECKQRRLARQDSLGDPND